MARKAYSTKSQIPKWYRRRIHDFEHLTDKQALYEYERIKIQERVRRARKRGREYKLEPFKPVSQVGSYDLEYLRKLNLRQYELQLPPEKPPIPEPEKQVEDDTDYNEMWDEADDYYWDEAYNKKYEAEKYIEYLQDYVADEAEAQAQGWIDAKAYKRKGHKGKPKGGEWLAKHVREAGKKIIDELEKIKADADKAIRVYDYYLEGERYSAMRKRVAEVLADSDTAVGRYNALNGFLAELRLEPMSADEGTNDDSLGDDSPDIMD